MGRLKASSATPTIRTTSSRAPLSADKIRNYRDTYRRNQHVAFLPACMSTSGRIHGKPLRLIFFLSNKQAEDYFAAFGYQPHRQEFCHRRGVFFQQNQGTIGMA